MIGVDEVKYPFASVLGGFPWLSLPPVALPEVSLLG